ncbi:distal tail protein Dit [Lacticaseibacillus zeae]|uniref:Phage tail family protein n=3 Tax=Lacticaseibacillus TaxID=2759736 RepID=A0ABD7Z9X6_LACZE|nr:distal tail protein Dit [Lacticaseibacillus sp. NCIMB 15475]WLV83706.1 phage tail family protein [Lacticaseibacillus sp. NCIMB 15475]
MANLIFGGRKIGSSVLQFSAARGITSEIENTSHSVGISDGEMLINSRLKSRIIPVTYDFVALSRREFERQLAPLLYSTDVQKLIIDDRPDEFWYAKVDGKIDMDRAYFLGTGTINFLVPDGIAHSVATKTFDNMPYKDVPVNKLHNTGDDWNPVVWSPDGTTTTQDGITTATNTSKSVIQTVVDPNDSSWLASGATVTISVDVKGQGSIGFGYFNANGWEDDSPTQQVNSDEYIRLCFTRVINSVHLDAGIPNFSVDAFCPTSTLSFRHVKADMGPTASPWSPNPADPEYYTNTITVHNGGTYPVEPVITATMHADNGMVGLVNDRPGILQFGTQEIDGYTTDVSEKGLNGDFSAPISGTIYNQSATNNPNWGGDSSKPNKQTGSINYASDSYNGPHMEPAYASTGTYWNGPAAKIPITATSQNTRNNNFTLAMMIHFETTVSQLGRMELTLEAGGKVQYQMVITDNNAVKDEIQVDCYVKDQQVGTMSLDRSKFTNDKLMQARLNQFGSSINFEVSPWNGKSGREMTVSLPPLTRPDMISENVEAFSVWFERNNTWGQAAMKLIAVQFDWQHVNWWTDIKNRFSNGDVLTIDVANAKTYLNGSENRTLHTFGNQWEQFKLPPGDTEIAITPSSWAQPFACEIEIREAWL